MTDPAAAATHSPERLAGREDTDRPPSAELRFEDVYAAHFEYVWRSLRRLGVSKGAVDDAVQDVFVVVHRRLHEFEGRSKLETWLFGIALRVARNHRKKAARSAVLEPLDGDVEDRSEHRPDRVTESRQAWDLVEAFLAELDEDKRAVFILAELEEHTAPEIAEALGIRTNTVYSRLRAARKTFEAAVKRHRVKEGRVET